MGLCSPSSSKTAVGSFANAARPRRVRALVACRLIAGAFVRLNCVPSNATRRHSCQNASGSPSTVARGRSMRCINSAKISHGNRARRSANELSASGVSNNSAKCSPNVPLAFIT